MAKYVYSQGSYGGNTGQKGSQYSIGRVKSIVLGQYRYDGIKDPDYRTPKDIGKISYESLYTSMNFPSFKGSSQPAYPIFGAFKQFPLLNEIVFIVPGPSTNMNDNVEEQTYYYFPPYSLWNSQNHNAFPNLEEYVAYLNTEIQNIQLENRQIDGDEVGKLPLGYMFSESIDVRSLRPFEGDTIIESRFGQSIRFGSTNITTTLNPWSAGSNNGKPITIIRNGQGKQDSPDYFEQTVENINRDPASIWMTSGQVIHVDGANSFPLNSFGDNKKIPQQNTQKIQRVAKSNQVNSPAEQDSKTL
jgi:hypothetical protein